MRNKQRYLDNLKKYLLDRNVYEKEVIEIIEDYESLYEEGRELDLTDAEIYEKLGSPEEIYKMIRKDVAFSYKSNQITGLMVFVSLIVFFLLGIFGEYWNYAWMVFFLIPVTGIITNVKGKDQIPALSVFVAVITYLIVGMTTGIWHPTWLIFLIIPISGILTYTRGWKLLPSLTPFIVLPAYLIGGHINSGFYQTGWLLFLLIPIVGLLTPPNTIKKIGFAFVIGLSMLLYGLVSIHTGMYGVTLLFFLLPVIYGVITNQITVNIDRKYEVHKKGISMGLIILTILIAYFVVSYLTGSWHITWLILLLVPILGIYSAMRFSNITAYTPFLSIIIFILLITYVDGASRWAWLVFFSIPITGILANRTHLIEARYHRNQNVEDDNQDDSE